MLTGHINVRENSVLVLGATAEDLHHLRAGRAVQLDGTLLELGDHAHQLRAEGGLALGGHHQDPEVGQAKGHVTVHEVQPPDPDAVPS